LKEFALKVAATAGTRNRFDSDLSSIYPLTVDFYIAEGLDQQIFRVHRDT